MCLAITPNSFQASSVGHSSLTPFIWSRIAYMRVHLVNPSHVSFGVGVITPRWLYVLAAATPATYGDPLHLRRNARAVRLRRSCRRATSSASASTPATRCAATRSATGRARARRVRRLRRHSRDAVSRRRRTSSAARTPSSRATAMLVWAQVARATASPARRSAIYDGGTDRRRRSSCRRAGTCCPRDATCGRRCRPCAAARSTARSARSGGPTARQPRQRDVDAVIDEIVELRRRGFRFIALADDNFYPVTLDRSRAWRAARRIQSAARSSSRRSAPSGSS